MAYCYVEGHEHIKCEGQHIPSSPAHTTLCQLNHEHSDQ